MSFKLLFLVFLSSSCHGSADPWLRRYIRSPPPRVMYLNQGVEFVFPLGVHYTLANLNEQTSFPVPTTGFESVLEFPRNKMAIMFSSMVNTLRLANFTVHSTIYSNESSLQITPAMKILGTDLKQFSSQASINRDLAQQTDQIIVDFIPRPAYYGSALYPFTKAVLTNSIKYENYWAWPWKDGGFDKFSDSPLIPYMEVEGLMPYYENEAFAAVAALFKGGTGSVVFLKPKGNVTILQLMLQPTALTEIFDENFPGWGVKTMKVKVPQASFTTTTRHAETLQKRGVVDTFCSNDVRENLFGVLRVASSYFLNPIVQTNHVQISKDVFKIASATGATLNSQQDYEQIPRSDISPQEEGTSSEVVLDETEATTTQPAAVEEVVEEESTGRSVRSVDPEAAPTSGETATELPREEVEVLLDGESPEDVEEEEVPQNDEGKGLKRAPGKIETYTFDEPFLWFLHATNEEPMFMGIIESFKRYKEQAGNKVISLANVNKSGKEGQTSVSGGAKLPLVDVVADTANINLWNC